MTGMTNVPKQQNSCPVPWSVAVAGHELCSESTRVNMAPCVHGSRTLVAAKSPPPPPHAAWGSAPNTLGWPAGRAHTADKPESHLRSLGRGCLRRSTCSQTAFSKKFQDTNSSTPTSPALKTENQGLFTGAPWPCGHWRAHRARSPTSCSVLG